MKISSVVVLEIVADDMNKGKEFYDLQEPGVGDYFWDSLVADIESLILYAGIHSMEFDFYKMLAKRFPYAIYYYIVDTTAYVVAVLPMKRNPEWIKNRLKR